MNNESVKKSILKLREDKGLTQEQVAVMMGVSRTSYQKIETGSTKLISDNVFKIADAMGTTPEEVVLGYLPIPEEGSILKDYRDMAESRYNRMMDEYERRIESLVNENIMLKEAHREDQRTMMNLQAILSRLEKKLDTGKND